MPRIQSLSAMFVFLALSIAASHAQGAAFTDGNLVVNRIGDGSTTLSNAANPVAVVEVSPTGVPAGNVIPLPSFSSGGNNQGGFTDSGTASSNGHMFANGNVLTLIGIDCQLGTASVTATTSVVANRNVASISKLGVVTIKARLTDAFSGDNARAATTTDGNDLWIAGNGSSGASNGIRYVDGTTVATTSTQIAAANLRNTAVFGGILFTSTTTAISSYGAPAAPPKTATAGTAITFTTGGITSGSGAFVFFDRDAGTSATNFNGLDTLYLIDGAVIEKYEWTGSGWTQRGGATYSTALFGLTAKVNGANVDLYATTGIASNNSLVKVVDDSGFGNTLTKISTDFTVLIQAGANFGFRGVAFAPANPPGNPTVNLSVTANSGTEAAATAITVTATASSAVTGAQTVDLAVSGTGITAGDYNLSQTTITIPNGMTTGSVTFTIVDDAAVEGAETATLTISNPSIGLTLGSTVSQMVSITDNDTPPGLMRITEFCSGGANLEFIEFTNVGGSPVDMTGWSFDDSSRTAGAFSISGFGTVQPGESVILAETTAAAFRTAWSLPATVKVVGGLNQNLSGGGDEMNIYDNTSALIDRLTYTTGPNGTTRWTAEANLGANTIATWQLSVVGDAKISYTATGGDVGNPGIYVVNPGATIRESAGTSAIAEGGATDTYTMVLNTQPSADVTVTINASAQATTNPTSLTFTNGNFNVAQSVTITAVDDATPEGPHTATITHSASSADGTYNGIAIGSVVAAVTDNDIGPAPTIVLDPATTDFLDSAGSASPLPISGVISDVTDPARTLGLDFTIADTDTPVGNLTVTTVSGNTTVVPNANLNLTGTGASRNLKITPAAVGFSTITVTVNDGFSNTPYVVNFAASAAVTTTPANTVYHTGTSDASGAVAIDANFMVMASDEDQTLRVYNRSQSGLPVTSTNFSAGGQNAPPLQLADQNPPRETDLEAAARVGNRIYWMASHSQSSGGANRPNRFRIFATDITGTGAATTLTFAGRYDHFRTDLLAWDANNVHGKGANFYGLTASTAVGVIPETPDGSGFNIEGLVFGPASTSTAYVCFRAPIAPASARTKALIVPVTNFDALAVIGGPAGTSGGTAGSAVFGAPIELDLGGRGIRSIDKNINDEFLIVAGPAANVGAPPQNFKLFTWNGQPASAPIERNAILTGLNPEAIVEVPTPLTATSVIQLLTDDGDTVWYNDGVISKDLPQKSHQKYHSDRVTLGAEVRKIYEIQGPGHQSPFNGASVVTTGVITAKVPTGDANSDGTLSTTQDEFVELVNTGNTPLDISGFTLADGPVGTEVVRFTFPGAVGSMTTVLPAGGAAVVFGGGVAPTIPGALAFSSSGLSLNNDGDTLTVRSSATLVVTTTYPSDAQFDQAVVRNPEFTGEFIQHGNLTGLARWSSPGRRTDGSAYPATGTAGGGLVINEVHADPNPRNSFYMQDATGDGNPLTSDGIFVFVSNFGLNINVGDLVQISGTVTEFSPQAAGSAITEISTNVAGVSVISSGNTIAATVVGAGGRVPPTSVIDNDSVGTTNAALGANNFDPTEDGIDFWETLEGMKVRINNARAVSPTNPFGEIYVIADNGTGATGLTARGGIILSENDFNPEWVQVDAAPQGVNVGATLTAVEGVLDYNFGRYAIQLSADISSQVASNPLQRETTSLTGDTANKLRVAAINVENLDTNDPPLRFTRLAAQIVNNLATPDIIALQEIQDNNGAIDDGTVSASATAAALIAAITTAGGPTYTYTEIAPQNNQDGGEPGGNIRVAYLYRIDRVTLVNRGGAGGATEAAVVSGTNGIPALNKNPVRVSPSDSAWDASRKPLVGEFLFNGVTVFLINNHFSSKGGSTNIYERTQPPINGSVDKRNSQAALVNGFVDSVLAINPNANVLVLGDLNEFDFNAPLETLAGSPQVLFNMNEILAPAERYSYVFEGNSQELDHHYATARLRSRSAAEFDIVHINAEFNDQDSDHDPDISRFTIANTAPAANTANIVVTKNTAFNGTLTATDADNDTLSFFLQAAGTKGTPAITNAATGAFSFTPTTGAIGEDSFTVTVSDGTTTTTQTVNVFINAAPVANAGTLAANQGVVANGTLAATDENTGETLTYSVVSQGAKGTVLVTNAATGAYTYTPAVGQSGADTFTFKANDTRVDSNVATVTVTINAAPVASAGTLSAVEDTVASSTLAAVDSDSPTLTYSLVAQAGKGTVAITNATTGAYTYTPTANANGSDSFTFKASDGALESNTVTVAVSIQAVNDAPVALGGTLAIVEDTAANAVLSAGDIDSATLAYSIVANPTKGTIVITNAATGAYTFTPNPNASGSDSFTFKANDGQTDSNTATVAVTITGSNDGPEFTSQPSAAPNPAKVGDVVAFSAPATDGDGDTLTYVWSFGDNVSGVGASPTHRYAAPGTFTATVVVSDGAGGTKTGSVNVVVEAGGMASQTPGDTDGNGDPDNDDDSVSDELEALLGTNPNDATDSPTTSSTPNALSLKSVSIKLNFTADGKDSIALAGDLPLAAGASLAGRTVVVDVGGVIRTFTLTAKGKSPKSNESFTLAPKSKNGLSKFTCKLQKGDYSSALDNEGIHAKESLKKASRTVMVSIVFGNALYQKSVTLTVTANKGKSAAGKQ